MGGRQVDPAQGRRRGDPAPRRARTASRCSCGAPAVVAAILDAGRRRRARRAIPGRGRMRMVVAGAPPPTRTIERVETELGWEFIQIYGLTETSPLLTINRAPRRVGRPRRRPSARSGWPRRRARARRAACDVDAEGEVLARSQPRLRRLLGAARGDRRRRSSTAGSTPATAATSTTALRRDHRPQEGRDHHRRRERLVDRGRGLPLPAPGGRRGRGDRRARREVGRDGQGARRAAPGRAGDRGGPDRALPRAARRTTSARPRSRSATRSPRTATGKLQKFKLREPYWAGRARQVN